MVLKLRQAAPDWTRAKCLGQAFGPESDPWFDNSGEGYENLQDLGLEICNGTVDGTVCPVRHGCLVFALLNNAKEGVWGGTSEFDRRAMRKMWPWDPKNPANPRPEWKWYEPGAVAKMLSAERRAELDKEDDDDE